jgi:pilus assembly protein CpaE
MTTADVVAVGAPPTFRQQVARALGREPAQVEWMPSVTAVEGLLAEGHALPSVVVLSPVIKEIDAFGLAEFVGRRAPGTAVVLVRDRPMNGSLPQAMRAGIRDVVDMTLGTDDLREALNRALKWSAGVRSIRVDAQPEASTLNKGAVISVFSSKGGAGKTFLATGLASVFAAKTKVDVALIDFDLDVGDVLTYFGRDTRRTVEDLMSVGDLTDRDAILASGQKVAEHLWVYAGTTDPGDTVNLSGESAGKVIRALRGTFGAVVVDGPIVFSDPALAAFDLSDAICLISGLDVVGIRHLSRALETLLALDIPKDRFKVVLNRADSKVGLSVQDVERVMKITVDGMIPSSRLVPTALNKGRPVYLDDPKAEVSKSLEVLADKLMALFTADHPRSAETLVAQPKKRRLFNR